MGAGKVCLVTGGSSGIGLEAAKALADSGARVYELSRRETHNTGIEHISGNVTDEESVRRAVEEIVSREGRLDVLVCCAGFGISGAVEFTRLEDAKKQLDVNFFGVVNTVKAALPVMREQRSGRIVAVSSVAGEIAIPFQTYYSVSKAAINAYIAALRNEVRPYGITAVAVMPGDIKTGFTAAREKRHEGDDIYGGRIGRSVATMEHDEQNGMSPAAAGRFICRVSLKKSVTPACTIGLQYKLFITLARFMPRTLVSRVVYMMYAK